SVRSAAMGGKLLPRADRVNGISRRFRILLAVPGMATARSPSPTDVAHDPRRERRLGLAYGLAAYGSWGVFPVYLKAVRTVPVVEALSHRIVWALAVLLVVTGVRREWRAVGDALRHRRALLVLSASTVCIALNWGVYIYSVTHDRILESSLGYYINPLI